MPVNILDWTPSCPPPRNTIQSIARTREGRNQISQILPHLHTRTYRHRHTSPFMGNPIFNKFSSISHIGPDSISFPPYWLPYSFISILFSISFYNSFAIIDHIHSMHKGAVHWHICQNVDIFCSFQSFSPSVSIQPSSFQVGRKRRFKFTMKKGHPQHADFDSRHLSLFVCWSTYLSICLSLLLCSLEIAVSFHNERRRRLTFYYIYPIIFTSNVKVKHDKNCMKIGKKVHFAIIVQVSLTTLDSFSVLDSSLLLPLFHCIL